MNPNISAIQYMGMIMRLDQLNIDYVLSLVQIVNNSFLSAKDVVTILQQIFRNEKSSKILIGTHILQYLVKNSNRNFHQAANKQSFQKSILGLLKRQRGKMNIIKQLRSNSQNWSRIQSRILYLVQLWYDAFILQQSKYPHIINTYKVLRMENIIFPPRNVNQRSLIAVQTQSPIFDNIQTISQSDKQKFKKRLNGLGLTKLTQKFQEKQKILASMPVSKQIDIDQISQKIAIIQSQDYDPKDVIKIVQQVKQAIQHGKVKPNQQKYWKQVKQAAQLMIQEWQSKNASFIQNKEQEYLQSKMNGKMKKTVSEVDKKQQMKMQGTKSEIKNSNQGWDLLGSDPVQPQNKQIKNQDQFNEWGDYQKNEPQIEPKKQMNLLDL